MARQACFVRRPGLSKFMPAIMPALFATWGAKHDQIEFHVCTLCGYTAKKQEADNCPACNFVWDRFERIR